MSSVSERDDNQFINNWYNIQKDLHDHDIYNLNQYFCNLQKYAHCNSFKKNGNKNMKKNFNENEGRCRDVKNPKIMQGWEPNIRQN